MRDLRMRISTAQTPEDQESLQREAMELKVEWSLALAKRQLELARERGDTEAEAEALNTINHVANPPTVLRQQVPRDPNAGIELPGGAR
jgi:hypothetical protein